MKNKYLMLLTVLALVALWGKEYAKPVFAQARAALTRDIDNPARNAVQFQIYGYYGGSTYHVPAGKTLVIEDVSFSTPYSNAGNFGIVTSLKGAELIHWFAPVGFSASGISTGGSWFGGRTTRIYADGGTDVFIQTNGSVAHGDCVFSGYLLDTTP